MQRRRGMSLLETMIAAILVTAMVISVMGTWPAYHQLIEKRKRRATAVFLVQRNLELALQAGFDDVESDWAGADDFHVESTISDVPQTVTYHITRTVTADPNTPLLKRVQVRVEYDEKGGHRLLEMGATLSG